MGDTITITDQIIKVFDYLGGKLGIVIDWGSQNVLPYIESLCRRYIQYEIALSLLAIGIAIIMIIVGIKLLKFGKKPDKEILGLLGIILLIATIPIFYHTVPDIIKCCFLPELKIYEFLQSYIN